VMQKIRNSGAIIAAGTSLEVWSAFRFIREASEKNVPVVILNIGKTRGDELAKLKLEMRLGELLPKITSTINKGRNNTS